MSDSLDFKDWNAFAAEFARLRERVQELETALQGETQAREELARALLAQGIDAG